MESLIQVLEQQCFEDTPFAVVALNSNGHAQVHVSGQVKGLLDEKLFASQFEDAHRLSLERTRVLFSRKYAPMPCWRR